MFPLLQMKIGVYQICFEIFLFVSSILDTIRINGTDALRQKRENAEFPMRMPDGRTTKEKAMPPTLVLEKPSKYCNNSNGHPDTYD